MERRVAMVGRACCPAHDDHTPSLSIDEENGKTLVHCFAGCSQEGVLAALRSRGIWPSRRGIADQAPSRSFDSDRGLEPPGLCAVDLDSAIDACGHWLKRIALAPNR